MDSEGRMCANCGSSRTHSHGSTSDSLHGTVGQGRSRIRFQFGSGEPLFGQLTLINLCVGLWCRRAPGTGFYLWGRSSLVGKIKWEQSAPSPALQSGGSRQAGHLEWQEASWQHNGSWCVKPLGRGNWRQREECNKQAVGVWREESEDTQSTKVTLWRLRQL